MSYRVELTGPAKKDLAAIPERFAWAIIAFCDGPLADNPYRVGTPLRGPFTGLRGARRGTYRIVYAIHDDRMLVEVHFIRGRPDAYAVH